MVRPAIRLGILLGLIVVLVVGCGGQFSRSSRDSRAAVTAVTGYLAGRRDNNLSEAYRHLSQASRELYSQADFVTYYRQFPELTWQRVGEPTVVTAGWIRVLVYDLQVSDLNGVKMPLPDVAYYVQKTGRNWGVALINPVLYRLDEVTDAPAVFEVIDSLQAVHPYSGSLLSRLYYTYISIGDIEGAQEALWRYYQVCTPSELPGFQAMQSHYLLSTGDYDQAVEVYSSAMEMAEAYSDIYPDAWHSRMLTFQGHAFLEAGDVANGRIVLAQAIAKDPTNQDARQMIRLIQGR